MQNIINSLLKNKKSFLVVGDAILDKYIIGKTSRISPEAPVPVVSFEKEYIAMGGAANVCANLAAMNQDVYISCFIGKDADGLAMKKLLDESGINTEFVINDNIRPTTVKTRVLAQNNQQIVRIDYEYTEPSRNELQDKLLNDLEKKIEKFDAILISDYLKGFLPEHFICKLIKMANQYKIKTFIDPKSKNLNLYKGAFLIKPNASELSKLTKMQVITRTNAKEAMDEIKHHFTYILTTLGMYGMLLQTQSEVYSYDAKTQNVFDVTGAGDTVLAYVAAAIAHDVDILEAVKIANVAAGIKISKVGTVPVSIMELKNTLFNLKENYNIKNSWERFKILRKEKKVVFTNGCFDILHAGHVQLLYEAKQQGDLLVVGLNDDASVKRLKGNSRPINSVEDRLTLLMALQCVDFVFIFEEDTASNLIMKICPDIYIKGGDNVINDVPEKKAADACNCEFKILSFLPGRSTTGILQRGIE